MSESTKTIVAVLTVIFTSLYLINPTFGVFELIPDNLPIIGNLDEVAATGFLLSALKYLGFDFTNIFYRKKN